MRIDLCHRIVVVIKKMLRILKSTLRWGLCTGHPFMTFLASVSKQNLKEETQIYWVSNQINFG